MRSIDNSGRALAGTDLDGNKYYELSENWRGRRRRVVELAQNGVCVGGWVVCVHAQCWISAHVYGGFW